MRALAPIVLLAERARASSVAPLALLLSAIAIAGGPVLAIAGNEAVIQMSAVLAS